MTIHTHGLFTRIETPTYQHANESCFVYGTTGPGVDMGIEIEGYGVLFLGLTALKEAAEVAGFAVNEEGRALEEDNAHLQHQLEQARATIAELEAELEAVGRAVARAAGVE